MCHWNSGFGVILHNFYRFWPPYLPSPGFAWAKICLNKFQLVHCWWFILILGGTRWYIGFLGPIFMKISILRPWFLTLDLHFSKKNQFWGETHKIGNLFVPNSDQKGKKVGACFIIKNAPGAKLIVLLNFQWDMSNLSNFCTYLALMALFCYKKCAHMNFSKVYDNTEDIQGVFGVLKILKFTTS